MALPSLLRRTNGAPRNVREWAHYYRRAGREVIPVVPRGKRPGTLGWQMLRLRDEAIDHAFAAPDQNVGIILGAASGDLADTDLDVEEAIRLAPRFLPATQTFGRPSKPRSHYTYVAKGAATRKYQDPEKRMLVELRADGAQTVFPPSTHESGEAITFVDPTVEPTEIDADDLATRVAKLAAATLLARNGFTDDEACALVARWDPSVEKRLDPKVIAKLRDWLKLPRTTTPKAATKASTPREHDPSHAIDLATRERRARAYARSLPPAISGQGGHDQAIVAAAKIERGFDLSEDLAFDILASEWNPRCEPPWSDSELRHKIGDAARSGEGERAWLLVDNSSNAPTASEPFPTLKISDVPDSGPTRWLVDHLWTEQAVGVIAGEPKTYKSFLGIHLAVCVASGTPVLGRYETQRGPVLCFNAEDRPSLTRCRVERMCLALDLNFTDLDLHIVDVPALRLDDAIEMQRLHATVGQIKPVLVMLDPMRDLHVGDENDAKAMAALLLPLRVLQRTYGCAVAVIHHMSKETETKRRLGQRLRGSSVLHGWIDSALYCERSKDGSRSTVTAEHRGAPAPDPFAFRLQENDGDTSGPLALEVVESTPGDALVVDHHDGAVLEALAGSSVPVSATALAKVVHVAKKTLLEVLKRLEAEGRVAQAQHVVTSASGRNVKTSGWVVSPAVKS